MEVVDRISAILNAGFWKGRRVLLTGHTGFKGGWLALLLERLGARTSGIALPPPDSPSLYEILSPWPALDSSFCDLRDFAKLGEAVRTANPEIVVHMAARPLVREAYRTPLATIETNTLGTVNLLEALRNAATLRCVLVVTSDKVYENAGDRAARSEQSTLGGRDPYSASKAAAELLTSAYARSFFAVRNVPVATARAGNVIGGGDWAADRIVPDLWRAYTSGEPVELRYPDAVRPWQHVLDPLYGYLLFVERMIEDPSGVPTALNFAPAPGSAATVLNLAEEFASALGAQNLWTIGRPGELERESDFLEIDASLASESLGWRAGLDVNGTVRWTSEWYRAFRDDDDMRRFSHRQIDDYIDLAASRRRAVTDTRTRESR